MEYIISIILSIIMSALIGIYYSKLDIITGNESAAFPIINKMNKKIRLITTAFLFAVVFICVSLFLVGKLSSILNLVKLIVTMGILAAASIIDLKKKIIPNLLIIIGISVRVIIYVFEYFFYNDVFFPQLFSDLFGFGVGFGILFISCVITKGAVGFGDVKLFGIIGLMTGAICTYSTLIISLILSSLVSVVLMIMKKKTRKDAVPFGPFIFAGYIITLCLTIF